MAEQHSTPVKPPANAAFLTPLTPVLYQSSAWVIPLQGTVRQRYLFVEQDRRGPTITLQGRWLKPLGFTHNAIVDLRAINNCIVLSVVEEA